MRAPTPGSDNRTVLFELEDVTYSRGGKVVLQ